MLIHIQIDRPGLILKISLIIKFFIQILNYSKINTNYTVQSSISDNMINSNLRDRTSRVEKLNQTLATKPSYYSNPSNSLNSSNSKPSNWKPSNSNNNSKPS